MIPVRERIVEELIYERVHLDADLTELHELERDLGDSLRRAIAEAAPPEEAVALTDRCLGRVLQRITAECLADMADRDLVRLAADDHLDADACPLCAPAPASPPTYGPQGPTRRERWRRIQSRCRSQSG